MGENAVMVFTGRSPEQILAEEGTQAWVLNVRRARKCEYVVCAQNRYTFSEFNPTEPHGEAFLIGRISEIVLSDEQPDPEDNRPERYIIKFKEFARIAVPNAWDGSRNPVSYIDVIRLGINPSTISFRSISRVREEPPSSGPVNGPLTIAQAKAGLAMTFGVPPEAIEITIKG